MTEANTQLIIISVILTYPAVDLHENFVILRPEIPRDGDFIGLPITPGFKSTLPAQAQLDVEKKPMEVKQPLCEINYRPVVLAAA